MALLRILAWIVCVIYATIPSFWLLIHPRAEYWRASKRNPYRLLLLLWIVMWAALALLTLRWRELALYTTAWTWIPAAGLFATGISLYAQASKAFSGKQLGGLPEVLRDHQDQRLVTCGIRARVRHPVYLGHLCEMVAWSLGAGLAVCFALTMFAVLTGVIMIRMEDDELEKRFGAEYIVYRKLVPAVLPRFRS